MRAVIDLLNRLADLLMWLIVRPPAGVPWRPVSGMERIWLAWNRLQPFVIQYVVEGRLKHDADLNIERLQRALDRVADSQPGMRVRLRGARFWLHWKADGPRPRLCMVDGNGWDGRSPDGAPFRDQPLDPVHGPIAELLVVKGDPMRFVFRVLHAASDGAGSMLFVQAFFAALREEKLVEVIAGPPIDAQVGRMFCAATPPPKEPSAPALIQPVEGFGEKKAWARASVAGDVDIAVARVGIALAESALVPVNKSLVRYAMPVDLRRLAKVQPSSANLTGMIRLDLAGPFASDDPVKTLHRDIIGVLARREFGADPVRAYRILRLISLNRLSRRARRKLNSNPSTMTTTAGISYIGGLKIADFSGADFYATSVFSVPPNAPFGRLLLGMVQTDAALEIVALQSGSKMSKPLCDLLHGVVRRLSEMQGELGGGRGV